MIELDAERFRRFWTRQERAVGRIVQRRLSATTREDREDVIQRTRVHVWTTFDPYGSEDVFAASARLIAYRACIDWIRENAAAKRSFDRVTHVQLDDLTDPGATPYDVVVANELSPSMARTLDALTPRHRKALGLVAEGASPREIAASLGCTVPRAYQIIVAARTRAASFLSHHR